MTDGGTLVADGTWSIHQRPRALRHNDTTFIGSITSDAVINISEFDNQTGEIMTTDLDTMSIADDHSSPSIYIRDDDRLVVFWSDRSDNQDQMKWSISDNALDISSFGDIQTFTTADNADYPQPLPWDGGLRLYYRSGGSLSGSWYYRDSSDGGESFGTEQRMTDFENDRIYVQAFKDGAKIHFAMGDHRMSDSGIYHWYLEGGDYYQTDGTLIQSADNALTSINDVTTVYDGSATGNNPAKQYDLIVENGTPHVAFTQHVETGSGGGDGDYRAMWGKWDGSQWLTSEITEMGGALPEQHYYEGGLSLDSQDPTTVYLSTEQADRNYQIQEWSTADAGDTWTKVADRSLATATFTDPTKRGRPISPRNHQGDLDCIWWAGEYNDFTAYLTQVRDE